MKIPGGLLIVIDGIDGVGKTTQIKLASEAFAKEGWDIHVARNLGGTPIGEALREVMLSPIERPPTVNLHISVAIQEALIQSIAEQRAAGKLIFMDRGPVSLLAYQTYGSGLDKALVWPYVEDGMLQLKPELTILYEGDIPTAVERARQSSGKADYFEDKDVAFFERVKQGYRDASKHFPMEVVNADRSIKLVQADTMKQIRQALKQEQA